MSVVVFPWEPANEIAVVVLKRRHGQAGVRWVQLANPEGDQTTRPFPVHEEWLRDGEDRTEAMG
jgi:hypothetical protein